jgi:hypothetical protein
MAPEREGLDLKPVHQAAQVRNEEHGPNLV